MLINVFSVFDTDIVSMLCNVANPTSDFVSCSTTEQRYFNSEQSTMLKQRWSDVEMLAG